MYSIWSDKRKAFKTYDGWTRTTQGNKPGNATMDGLADVVRFTAREAAVNENKLPSGQRFRRVPGPIEWSDFNE